jgi:hypothetical protein
MVFYGGNKETLVGNWESYYLSEDDYNSEETTIKFILNKDGTGEIRYTVSMTGDLGGIKSNKGPSTWELSDTEDKIIITDSEGNKEDIYFMFFGEGVYFGGSNPVDESDYYTKLN